MTEKLARRGTPVITEYAADYLARSSCAITHPPTSSPSPPTQSVQETLAWLQRPGPRHIRAFRCWDWTGRSPG